VRVQQARGTFRPPATENSPCHTRPLSIFRNPAVKKSLMRPESAVKTALKKRPQTRGLGSNGGNP
jgi:hypothetical protein